MSLATVKLTGNKLHDPSLGGLNGYVELALSDDLVDTANGQLIKAAPIRLAVDDGVMTPSDFVINDALSPTSTYTVTQKFRGLPEKSYTIQLLAADGSEVDLSAKTPVTVDTTPLPGVTVTNAGISGQVLLSLGNFQAEWADAAAASVSSVNGRQGAVVGLAEQSSLDATNTNLAGLVASLGSAAFSSTSAFDPAGAADTAQTDAETYAAGIVSSERTRALAAEALLLPLAGGALTGALDMSAHKITGGAPGAAGTDFVIMSQLPTIPGSLPPSGAAGGDLQGTYPNPTLVPLSVTNIAKTLRLDQMAAPTAALNLNSQKITSLTPGVASTDAATVGQLPSVPSSLPPNGAAGGDLSGSYPNPTLNGTANVESIIRANRLDQMAAPTSAVGMGGQKITGGAAGVAGTDFALVSQLPSVPTSLPPNGAAGGDLQGSYPNPTVNATTNFKTQVATVRLDQMALPTAALNLNGQKLTGGAAASAGTDYVIFSQVPVVGAAGSGATKALSANDATTTNSRTPTAHASTHAVGGSDALTPDAIGSLSSNWLDMLGLGLLTVPPTESGFTVNITAGNMVCNLVTATKTKSIQTLGIQITAAGVTGSGVNALALYTETGVLIDQTGDMTTVMSSISFAEGTMASAHTVTAGTNYYLCALTHFSGTVPKAAATGTASTANIPVLNGHYISVFKTAQTSFPSSFTPSTFSLNTGHYVMYGR